MLKCGHAMHHKCYATLLASDYRCPTCKKAVADMSDAWAEMEEALETNMEKIRGEIPDEVMDRNVMCLCNDCEIKFERKFNPFVMYKCTKCNGFNTTPIQE